MFIEILLSYKRSQNLEIITILDFTLKKNNNFNLKQVTKKPNKIKF